jgi:hypothetical protein
MGITIDMRMEIEIEKKNKHCILKWAGRSGIKMNYNRRMYEGLRERISNEIFGIRL